MAGRYKAKTAMYEALMFLLIWYSASNTLFQMIRSKVFISDCGRFFDTIATFIQTIAGRIVLTGKNVAQISDGISNFLIIRATGICWNQVVCKRLSGKQRLCLKMENLSETQRSK